MTWFNIPKDWTGKQALTLVEFLDELSAAIWNVHEIKMLDAWHKRYSKPKRMTETANKELEDQDGFPF
jgi:hypothetical protein